MEREKTGIIETVEREKTGIIVEREKTFLSLCFHIRLEVVEKLPAGKAKDEAVKAAKKMEKYVKGKTTAAADSANKAAEKVEVEDVVKKGEEEDEEGKEEDEAEDQDEEDKLEAELDKEVKEQKQKVVSALKTSIKEQLDGDGSGAVDMTPFKRAASSDDLETLTRAISLKHSLEGGGYGISLGALDNLVGGGNKITIKGEDYYLQGFHWHFKSEHTVDGRGFNIITRILLEEGSLTKEHSTWK